MSDHTEKESDKARPRVRFRVLREIDDERLRQDKQWGGPGHDDKHTHDDWLGFIADHTVRADLDTDYRSRLVKVAALAVAAIESHDRRRNNG